MPALQPRFRVGGYEVLGLIGVPTPLFAVKPGSNYAASSDGQRFLIGTLIGDTEAPPTVILNWTALLKK